jgi:galactokinase
MVPLMRIEVSAPGRADFLNTHQDYKGLPVVPAAINLRTCMVGESWNKNAFSIISLDLKEQGKECEDYFLIERQIEYREKGWFGNYFRAIVNLMLKLNPKMKIHGMKIAVKSQIPMGSGLGSSAALEVAFIQLLNHAYGLNYDERTIAEIAYSAENKELKIPCGRLDQYSSSFGGIIKLECRPPYNIEKLPAKNLIFVILDSGIRHSTAEIHPVRQAQIDEGLKALMESTNVSKALKKKLGFKYYEPRWEDISEEEILPYLSLLNKESAKRILYTIKAQKSTELALKLLKSPKATKELQEELIESLELRNIKREKSGLQLIGKIMNYQHELMRDLYDLSLPKLERIRNAALEAGACGVKISGAGIGGSLVALVKDFKEGKKVLKAGLEFGAKSGWISKVSEGAKIETLPFKLRPKYMK